ncbi:DUF2180 family protein [Streptomyces decoyicus]|uniref:DUF2180 family protein n=1 Tax=Streptomyces decoyicus TaxID=249567 RepID=UPI0004AA1702|nr:DUF2180 family protein [Streptomyces decoyicus]KOG44263.1 hypothetical protein ADK74_14430 [Streptomyces decoyicus]QZY14031.1 DUF2180 family protein [Streptomyces decoyicus]
MNCYDCTPAGNAAAVAICRNCGAALCHQHAWSAPQTVTRVQGVGQSTLPDPARRIVCKICRGATQSI